ncbi:MAG: TolC family protein [Myxococcota bacterium]
MVPWVWSVASAAEPVELTLHEALDRLIADSPDWAAAEARVASASGIARQAAAGFLPIVAAQGTYTRNDSEVVFGFSQLIDGLLAAVPIPVDPAELPDVPDTVIQPLEVWSGAASVRIPLVAPVAIADWTAARRSVRALSGTTDEIRLELESGLIAAAAGAEAAAGVVAAATKAVDVAGDHLAATEIAQVAGTATSVDVLGAKADVARRRSELAESQANLASAQEQLGGLLGIDGPATVVLPEAAPLDPTGATRPAITAADARVGAARAQVQSAWWRQFPTLAATGAATAATEPYPTGNQTAWRVGLEATWTLYDGGFRYGKLHQAQADQAAAQAARTSEQLRVSREQREAERNLAVAQEQLTLAMEQANLAAEASEVAQLGLSAGTVSPLQARDVETDAFRAEVGVVGARARLRIAEASLRRARGLDQRW